MQPSERDRIMSLHRRAYACATETDWHDLAQKLGCPIEAVDQFWRTAQQAKDAGMSAKEAFPLAGEVTKPLSLDCQPGDLVWWRTVNDKIEEAEFVEWDNYTAIVRNASGLKAVRCA